MISPVLSILLRECEHELSHLFGPFRAALVTHRVVAQEFLRALEEPGDRCPVCRRREGRIRGKRAGAFN